MPVIQGKRRKLLALVVALLLIGPVSCHKNQPQTVTLTWKPSASVPGVTVVGYNVYRSTTPGGPYVLLASGVPEPRYEDRLLMSERTYFYIVRAVDQARHESIPSNETQASIP